MIDFNKYATSIPNAQMQHICKIRNILEVWFCKEIDAINFLNQTPVEKRAMFKPLRMNKWSDSTFRVDIFL